MLNPIFWKKVQGQKHPGRWGIVEHQIPSTKVLFKTNTKSHKHPGMGGVDGPNLQDSFNMALSRMLLHMGHIGKHLHAR